MAEAANAPPALDVGARLLDAEVRHVLVLVVADVSTPAPPGDAARPGGGVRRRGGLRPGAPGGRRPTGRPPPRRRGVGLEPGPDPGPPRLQSSTTTPAFHVDGLARTRAAIGRRPVLRMVRPPQPRRPRRAGGGRRGRDPSRPAAPDRLAELGHVQASDVLDRGRRPARVGPGRRRVDGHRARRSGATAGAGRPCTSTPREPAAVTPGEARPLVRSGSRSHGRRARRARRRARSTGRTGTSDGSSPPWRSGRRPSAGRGACAGCSAAPPGTGGAPGGS